VSWARGLGYIYVAFSFGIVADVIADAILLLSPLNLLRGLADPSLRRKLGIIFSTCVITTIVSTLYLLRHPVVEIITSQVSLVHAAYIINRAGIKVLISAIVEASTIWDFSRMIVLTFTS